MKNEGRRTYRMGARAEAAEATGDRILDAALALFWDSPGADVSLDEVARAAGVTRQTVIRRFGGKEGVMAAAAARENARVRDQRATAPVGDVPAAVTVLVDHYEQYGDGVLRLLAEQSRSPALAAVVESGGELHRQWCRTVFEPALRARTGAARRRLLAQLVAVCDVTMWGLLRRRAGLSRQQTELAIIELIGPILEGS